MEIEVLIIYDAQSEKECGENEVKSDCAGCELKNLGSWMWEDKNTLEKTPCRAICRLNECYCSPHAYRRNASMACVPISECREPRKKISVRCEKENEIYSFCKGCEGKCETGLKPCPHRCHGKGCFCPMAKGYVRDEEGNCIQLEDCEK
ncbi:unnamed protein product [Dracunculus medinensis]|uniref:TIL domain-containing protein n=1 Tax=Dracunculus medinensis TaxID=318479 RepID=A0A0N4UDD4_DRAME|nr:unnamed protein product [Dracunculus medinensis]